MAEAILLFLVAIDFFMVLATASEGSPSPSPSMLNEPSPMSRKLGFHHLVEQGFHDTKYRPSPSPTPQHGDDSAHSTKGEPTPIESANSESINLQTKEIHLKHHDHSADKSVAGGAVILGCLAMVFSGTVFCYIKATGRARKPNSTTQSEA